VVEACTSEQCGEVLQARESEMGDVRVAGDKPLHERDRGQAEVARDRAGPERRGGRPARRADGHYLKDNREPDLAILVRICRVLGLRPDVLLGYDQAAPGSEALLVKRAAVAAHVDVLDAGSLNLALLVVQAIASTTGLRSLAPVQADAPAAGRRPRGKAATPKEAPGRR